MIAVPFVLALVFLVASGCASELEADPLTAFVSTYAWRDGDPREDMRAGKAVQAGSPRREGEAWRSKGFFRVIQRESPLDPTAEAASSPGCEATVGHNLGQSQRDFEVKGVFTDSLHVDDDALWTIVDGDDEMFSLEESGCRIVRHTQEASAAATRRDANTWMEPDARVHLRRAGSLYAGVLPRSCGDEGSAGKVDPDRASAAAYGCKHDRLGLYALHGEERKASRGRKAREAVFFHAEFFHAEGSRDTNERAAWFPWRVVEQKTFPALPGAFAGGVMYASRFSTPPRQHHASSWARVAQKGTAFSPQDADAAASDVPTVALEFQQSGCQETRAAYPNDAAQEEDAVSVILFQSTTEAERNAAVATDGDSSGMYQPFVAVSMPRPLKTLRLMPAEDATLLSASSSERGGEEDLRHEPASILATGSPVTWQWEGRSDGRDRVLWTVHHRDESLRCVARDTGSLALDTQSARWIAERLWDRRGEQREVHAGVAEEEGQALRADRARLRAAVPAARRVDAVDEAAAAGSDGCLPLSTVRMHHRGLKAGGMGEMEVRASTHRRGCLLTMDGGVEALVHGS